MREWEFKMIAKGKLDLVRKKSIQEMRQSRSETEKEVHKNERRLESIRKKQSKLRESLKNSELTHSRTIKKGNTESSDSKELANPS